MFILMTRTGFVGVDRKILDFNLRYCNKKSFNFVEWIKLSDLDWLLSPKV